MLAPADFLEEYPLPEYRKLPEGHTISSYKRVMSDELVEALTPTGIWSDFHTVSIEGLKLSGQRMARIAVAAGKLYRYQLGDSVIFSTQVNPFYVQGGQ